VPIAERIAQIRARKAQERQRAREKAERRNVHETAMRSRDAQKAARPAHPAPASAHRRDKGPSTPGAVRFGRRGR